MMEAQPDAGGPQVSIVVPAYNEAGAIVETMQQLKEMLGGAGFSGEIVVVDDGSTDGTSEKLQAVEGVRLVEHEQNLGYGAALKSGIRAAAGEIIVISDADGTYPIDRIPDLVTEMDGHDMVVGARTGEEVRVPAIRKPAKWFITALASYLSDQKIPDLNSGLRAFRRHDALALFGILPNGFSWTTTITLAMINSGMRVKYIPINYHHRTGRSKINPIRDTWNFIILIVRTVALFNPLKVFLPAAAAFVLGGVALGLYNAIVKQDLGEVEVMLVVAGLIFGAIGMLADIVTRTRLFLTD